MTDVFISYAREDRARVRPIADALVSHGLTVWWDPELRAGHDFRSEITLALGATKAMIVAWSRYSTASRFVRDEADEGAARGILFPVLLDLVDVPLGFRQTHTLDLTDWNGDPSYPPCEALVQAIVHFVAPDSNAQAAAHETRPARAGMSHFSITGVLARARLLMRSVILAGAVAALASVLWGFVAFTSNNIADTCAAHPDKGAGLGELFSCADFWGGELAAALVAFVLTLITRSLTFWADGIFGTTSLSLFSRSFATTILAAILLSAPVELELQLSSYSFLRPFRDAVFLGDGSKLLARSKSGTVVWDTRSGAHQSTGNWPAEDDGAQRSPDGSLLLTIADGRLFIENARQRSAKIPIVAADCTEESRPGLCAVNFASFAPDGQSIVTASNDGIARIWNTAGTELLALKGHRDKLYSARFSADGRWVATTSADRTIGVWSVRRGTLRRRFTLASPLIGEAEPNPSMRSQLLRVEGVPRYAFDTVAKSTMILYGVALLAFAVLLSAGLKVTLKQVFRPQFQQWVATSVMIGAVACLAFIYATSLPAEGMLFWLGFAALLAPFVALGRLVLAALMKPAFARTA